MSVGKIILKSTTNMTLNDRFTVLRQENPYPNEDDTGLEGRRQAAQASRKNQRLAAMMERRPAVLAVFKSQKNVYNRLNGQQSVPVKQRLAVQGRLSIPEGHRGAMRGRFTRGKGYTFSRGRGLTRTVQTGTFQTRGGYRGTASGIKRGYDFGRGRGRGGPLRGVSRGRGGPLRGVSRGRGGIIGSRGRGRGAFRSRGRGTYRGGI